MSYQLARIDSEYNTLFPAGPPPSEHGGRAARAQYQAWNQEVVGASQVAARQQTALSTLDTQATQTQTVLRQSQAASGEVEQLQLIAQMIGITNSELLVLEPDARDDGARPDRHGGADARPSSSSRSARATTRAADTRTRARPTSVPSTLP